MDHRDYKINEISNDDTKTTSYTINNLEEPTSQSYGSLSHRRIIRERRNRRELRKYAHAHALYSIRRLPVQVTNNPLMNQFFNGSTFF
ncbi:hypothetical protein RhiirA4_399068 [Rhizophagus irregularis]|uniref:Uncharacterized protein n=1 Tax=Rhizophagus irregularis TaxID=588596 RepID=A0A2I1GAQ0_9GLOM|nr:hypothetical protein RhiirA4_399068 [Rhizophagus irregularis]